MDYYKILELKRDCTDADIKKAYRRLAVQWHPEKSEGKNKEAVQSKFRELSESYCVLQDAKLRAIFDQYGYKGLKNGLPNGKGGFVGAWSYNDNPVEQFAVFFGSFSPFADFFNEDAGYARLFNTMGDAGAAKMEPQVINLYCSLEDLYHGCSKKQKIVRQKLSADGSSTEAEPRILDVQVQAGWRAGTKLTFKSEGDEAFETVTGDVVLVLKEKPHPRFKRVKNDLCYTATITLLQALTGLDVHVTTLDGRTLPISVNEIVRPGMQKTVPGEGMPLVSDPDEKGNLIIDFNILFPESLSEDQKTSLKAIM